MHNDSVQITQDTELRKLRHVLGKIIELVDADETILYLLMGNITNDPSDANSGPKFSDAHRTELSNTVKNSGDRRATEASIFMDEWITMAEKRTRKLPTVQNLLDVLVRCQLFRLADYVADISNQMRPPRPNAGPAKKVDISIPGEEVEVLLNGVTYPFDSVNSDNRNRSKPSPNSPRINLSRSTNQTDENNLSILTNPERRSPLMSHPFHVVHSSEVETRSNLMEFSNTLNTNSNIIPNISALQLEKSSYGDTIQGKTTDVVQNSNISHIPLSPAQQGTNAYNDEENHLPVFLNNSNIAQMNSDYIPAISFLNGSEATMNNSQSHKDTQCSSSSLDTDDD